MEHMTLELIAACCNGTYFGEETKKNIEVSGRRLVAVMPGSVFASKQYISPDSRNKKSILA